MVTSHDKYVDIYPETGQIAAPQKKVIIRVFTLRAFWELLSVTDIGVLFPHYDLFLENVKSLVKLSLYKNGTSYYLRDFIDFCVQAIQDSGLSDEDENIFNRLTAENYTKYLLTNFEK